MVRLGRGSHIGMGVTLFSAASAVAADIDWWYRVDDGFDDLTLERDRIEFNELTDDDKRQEIEEAGQRRVVGTLSLKIPYSNAQDLFRFLTGHNVAVSGVGPFDYAFVPVSFGDAAHVWAGSTQRALAIEVHRGVSANSTYVHKAFISEATFTYEPNGFVSVSLTIMGGGQTRSVASVPTFPDDRIITPTGQATPSLTIDAVTYICRTLSIALNLGLEQRYDLTGIEHLLPYPTAKREITISAEIEAEDDDAIFDAALEDPKNNTLGPVVVTITTGAGAAERTLLWSFPAIVLDSPIEPRVQGIGPATRSLTMQARRIGATPSYAVTVTNGDAAYAGVLP